MTGRKRIGVTPERHWREIVEIVIFNRQRYRAYPWPEIERAAFVVKCVAACAVVEFDHEKCIDVLDALLEAEEGRMTDEGVWDYFMLEVA